MIRIFRPFQRATERRVKRILERARDRKDHELVASVEAVLASDDRMAILTEQLLADSPLRGAMSLTDREIGDGELLDKLLEFVRYLMDNPDKIAKWIEIIAKFF